MSNVKKNCDACEKDRKSIDSSKLFNQVKQDYHNQHVGFIARQFILGFFSKWGSPGLKVKFKLSLSPKANIVMYIHIHSDI